MVISHIILYRVKAQVPFWISSPSSQAPAANGSGPTIPKAGANMESRSLVI